MNIPIKVYALLADPNTDAQVVVLKDEQDQALLPIWIGASEATAIRLAMENIPIPRPLTHDLLKEMLPYLNVRLDKAVISDVQNNTYYAALYFEPVLSGPLPGIAEGKIKPSKRGKPDGGQDKTEEPASTTVQIDARPSDAIVLSLRCGTPLYVAEEVLDKKDTNDGFSEWLARTRPKDSGSSSDA